MTNATAPATASVGKYADPRFSPHRPPAARAPSNLFPLIGLAVLAALRLYLTGDREILTGYTDDWALGHQSLHILDPTVFPSYGPANSLFWAIVRKVGIPGRVANELLLTLSAYAFFLALALPAKRTRLALMLAFLYFINPLTYQLLDRISSYTLATSWTLLLCAALLTAALRANRSYVLLSCVVLLSALIATTRVEGTIVVASMSLACGALWLFADRSVRMHSLSLLAATTFGVWLGTFSAIQLHSYFLGVPEVSKIASRAYGKFFSLVASLPGPPNIPHVYVDADRRKLAYTLSPTLASMRDRLESREWGYFEVTRRAEGVDDLGNGWLNWQIDNTLRKFGDSEVAMHKVLSKINNELADGIERNSIKTEWILFGVLPVNSTSWIPKLPSSFARVYDLGFSEVPASYRRNFEQEVAPSEHDIISMFNAAFLRRQVLVNSAGERTSRFDAVARAYAALADKALGTVLTVLTFAYAGILGVTFRRRTAKALDIAIIILGSFFIGRLAFYSLMDAAMWNATVGYVMANSITAPWLALMILVALTERILLGVSLLVARFREGQSPVLSG